MFFSSNVFARFTSTGHVNSIPKIVRVKLISAPNSELNILKLASGK